MGTLSSTNKTDMTITLSSTNKTGMTQSPISQKIDMTQSPTNQTVMPHPTSQPNINQQSQCTQPTTRKRRRSILQNLLLMNMEGRMSQEDILPKQRLRMMTELLGVSTVSSCQMVEYRL